MTAFERVTDGVGIEAVAALACEIWNQHFVPIIGQAQVDYMLETIQGASAIRGQITNGYEYFLVVVAGERVGYFALVPSPEHETAMLSKLYIRAACRGGGVGREAIAYVERLCAERGIGKLWLTVNVHNEGPIAFYRRMGFVHAGPLVQDIGSGFVMDDYRMEKIVGEGGGELRTSNIELRTSNVEYRTLNIEHRTSNVEHRTSNVEYRTLNIEFSSVRYGTINPWQGV
jgi:diamine N-acetyltransferase